mmetsp:Transcript_62500/g.177500  ORF Transcript_62500/g.177500 Transcript_62500/m.177500 type:complete len:209 (+) Transcript_62500:233-859(+)
MEAGGSTRSARCLSSATSSSSFCTSAAEASSTSLSRSASSTQPSAAEQEAASRRMAPTAASSSGIRVISFICCITSVESFTHFFKLIAAMASVICRLTLHIEALVLSNRATAFLARTTFLAISSASGVLPRCACARRRFCSRPSSARMSFASLSRCLISILIWNCISLALTFATDTSSTLGRPVPASDGANRPCAWARGTPSSRPGLE